MARYIDADAFLEHNAIFADREFDHPKYQESLREIVDREPTVDAVPVIRCKDCKWHIESKYLTDKVGCDYLSLVFDNEFYCGYGEKVTE